MIVIQFPLSLLQYLFLLSYFYDYYIYIYVIFFCLLIWQYICRIPRHPFRYNVHIYLFILSYSNNNTPPLFIYLFEGSSEITKTPIQFTQIFSDFLSKTKWSTLFASRLFLFLCTFYLLNGEFMNFPGEIW